MLKEKTKNKKTKSKTKKKRGPKRKKQKVSYRTAKNVGLNKRYFSKIKQEYHDIDYVHKLDDKQKKWLSEFMQEDLGANLRHSGRKKYKTKQDKKDVFDRNNARNRDIYSLAKATGRTVDVPYDVILKSQEDSYVDFDYESELIKKIDETSDE